MKPYYWSFKGDILLKDNTSEEVFEKRELSLPINDQSFAFNIVHLEKINDRLLKSISISENGILKKGSSNPFFYSENLAPIIFFGYEDFFGSKKEKDHYSLTAKSNRILWKKLGIPEYYNFLDSSIWCYYISLRTENLEKEILEVLKNIEFNYSFNLYNTYVAREFLELHIRIAQNSFITGSKAHAKSVTPYLFHSETEMALKTNSLPKIKPGIKWGCLLVDDYADLGLATTNGFGYSKKEIIEKIFNNKDVIITSVTEKYNDQEKRTCIIWKTLLKLSEKTYDILLLDYLLGDNNSNNNREFSHEILIILDGILNYRKGYTKEDFTELLDYIPKEELDLKEKSLKNKLSKIFKGIISNKGPLGKYWIFNISSFQVAFLDRLREQGLGHNNEYWNLSRGADPINTPELFRYSFYLFANLQISQIDFNKTDIIHFLAQNDIQFEDDEDEIVRLWAKRIYGAFLYKFGRKEIIGIDAFNKSLFADSYKDDIEADYIELYEHVKDLLNKLAYGSGFEHSQMMEAFRFIKKSIPESDKVKKTLNYIGKYIAAISKEY